MERAHILKVLDDVSWNQARAAEILGIGRNTLWRKLKDYGIQPAENASMLHSETPPTILEQPRVSSEPA